MKFSALAAPLVATTIFAAGCLPINNENKPKIPTSSSEFNNQYNSPPPFQISEISKNDDFSQYVSEQIKTTLNQYEFNLAGSFIVAGLDIKVYQQRYPLLTVDEIEAIFNIAFDSLNSRLISKYGEKADISQVLLTGRTLHLGIADGGTECIGDSKNSFEIGPIPFGSDCETSGATIILQIKNSGRFELPSSYLMFLAGYPNSDKCGNTALSFSYFKSDNPSENTYHCLTPVQAERSTTFHEAITLFAQLLGINDLLQVNGYTNEAAIRELEAEFAKTVLGIEIESSNK